MHKCVRKPPFDIPTSFFCSVKKERGKWQIFQLEKGKRQWYRVGRQFGSSWRDIRDPTERSGAELLLGDSESRGPWKCKMTAPNPRSAVMMTFRSYPECPVPALHPTPTPPFSGPPKFKSPRTSPNHCPHILPLISMFGWDRILKLLRRWRGSVQFWESIYRYENF